MIPLLAATTTVLAFAASTERSVSPARELWVRFGREFPNPLLEETLGLTAQVQEVLGEKRSIQAVIRMAKAEQFERMLDWVEHWFQQAPMWQSLFYEENLPASVLRYFAEYSDVSIIEKVVSHKNAPVDILIKFSKHKYASVKDRIAGNPNTPGDILRRYSKYKDRYIRNKVAGNKSTPTSVLKNMYDKCGPDQYIRNQIRQQLILRGEWQK